MSTTREHRPRAQQNRSRETEQRIIDAALQVLTEGGAASFSTASVSDVAGVAVGSIYRRFGTKEHLLRAAQEEFIRAFEGTVYTGWAAIPKSVSADPEATIAYATTVLVKAFQRHAPQMKAFLLLGIENRAVHKDGAEASQRGGKVYAELILRHRTVIDHADPEAAIDFAYGVVYATCAHRLIHGQLESPHTRPWSQLIAENSSVVCAYLLRA